jgi:hypothetical protein
MPPRYVTLAIVAFWLATTGWMASRDLFPRFRTGEPPPFTIDLTDEVSLADVVKVENPVSRFTAQTIPWIILLNGERVGFAVTRVQRQEDRTFDLQAELRFKELKMPWAVQITSLMNTYRVTSAGDLRGMSVRLILRDLTGLFQGGMKDTQIEVGMEAEVEDGMLIPHAYLYEPELRHPGPWAKTKKELLSGLKPIPVPERGAVLNTLQPLNRQLGLREGQTWTVPRLDPLEAVTAILGLTGPPRTRYLDARVSAAPFTWDGKEVPCWRIDYAEPSNKISARTWVQRSDGLVLQQEASHDHMHMVLRRDPRR